MNQKTLRKLTFIYPLIMIIMGIQYSRFDPYQIDGDAIAFMDIADAILQKKFHLIANGYWNPGYAVALALGDSLFHPSRINELQIFYYVNLFIFIFATAASYYFVSGVVKLRDKCLSPADRSTALSLPILHLASFSLLFCSFQRELSLGKIRADSLLLVIILIVVGFLTRLQATGRLGYYPLIGAGLGCAYLTKSYAFLPATLLLVGLLIDGFGRKDGSRTRAVVGAVLAGGVFLLFSGPYITAISIQRGRLTIGESARLNYAFFIDQMDRWHEWHRQALGHALGNFKNAEDAIVDVPAVYSYARHLLGTYPLWFDPANWTDGMQPQYWLSGHLQRLVRCSELLVRFLVDHPEALIYAATLFVTGHRFCNMGEVKKPFFAVTALGVAMLSIYFPVDIQDRYISVVFLLIVIPILSLIRPARVTPDLGAAAATILLAGLTMTNAARDVAQSRRVESGAGHAGGAYNGSIYTAAQSLAELGISPGSKLACMGDSACYVDQYWARLASSQIAAEIEVPNNEDPALFWQKLANKTNVLNALQDQNIKALVAIFPNGIASTEGWQRLGTGHFYVYLP